MIMCSLQLAIPQLQLANNMSYNNFCWNHTHIIKKTLSLPSSCPNNPSQSSSITKSSPLLRLRLAGRPQCGVSSRIDIEEIKNIKVELPEGLDQGLMPKHVAVIMDGNRRWAKSKGLSPQQGHRAGGEAFKKLCRNCLKYGVKVVTVFAFSTENWARQQDEVDFLMELFQEVSSLGLKEVTAEDDHGVRLFYVGNRGQLPEEHQKLMRAAEESSKGNERMQVLVALNYSGRYDIAEATKKIARKVRDGALEVEEIDDGMFEKHLETNGMEFPNPDLMIRSSGELRVSNFMLWQLAYTELFFTDKMFPDFDDTDLIQAFAEFQKRQRRFGGHKS